MKTLLSLIALLTLGSLALADIQDPPVNDFGPTRKLGRGLANVFPLTALQEFFDTYRMINEREGNSAALTYGVVKGVGRVVYRNAMGIYEVVTFPFPTERGTYQPPYRSTIPWIHAGYYEFPPELGFESKYRYTRENVVYP